MKFHHQNQHKVEQIFFTFLNSLKKFAKETFLTSCPSNFRVVTKLSTKIFVCRFLVQQKKHPQLHCYSFSSEFWSLFSFVRSCHVCCVYVCMSFYACTCFRWSYFSVSQTFFLACVCFFLFTIVLFCANLCDVNADGCVSVNPLRHH